MREIQGPLRSLIRAVITSVPVTRMPALTLTGSLSPTELRAPTVPEKPPWRVIRDVRRWVAVRLALDRLELGVGAVLGIVRGLDDLGPDALEHPRQLGL